MNNLARGRLHAAPRRPHIRAIARLGRYVLSALLLFTVSAQAAVYSLVDREIIPLPGEVSYREDLGDQTPFERISTAQEGWRANPLPAKGEPVRLWARFDLPTAPVPRRALILTGPWDRLEYFIVRDGVLVARERTGIEVPQSARATHLMASNFLTAGVASVEIPSRGTTTVYVRVSTDNRQAVMHGPRFTLLDEAAVRAEERRDRLLQGLFLGALLILMAYNLALYFVEGRDRSYLHYVASLACAALGWLAYSGLGFQVLWPEHPGWDRYALWVAASIGGYTFAQFARLYLDTRTRLPAVDRQLRIVALVFLLLPPMQIAMAYPLDAEWARDLVRLNTLAFMWLPAGLGILVLHVCAAALAEKHPSARLFTIAVASIAAGSFLSMVPEVAQVMPWLIHGHQAGVVAMGVLLSIGMGLRMRQLRGALADREVEKARLQRFLSPKVSELIAAGQMDDPLATRRREVTVVFIDLRGFTAFSEVAAPEDVMRVLREYHAEVGRLVSLYEGTVEHFAGDGVMMTFNDPATLPDPALSAVRMAVELRDAVMRLSEGWSKLGFELGCGLGIAQGYATIGTIGFPGRQDYGVIGAVCNLAARLCARAATGQVLVSQRVYSRVSDKVVAQEVGEMELKGFREPGVAYSVIAIRDDATAPSHSQ